MRRSKYGYLLLALLVITGLAGTINSTSISSKERKFAANSLKDTRNDVLASVRGLSKAQLQFKTRRGKCSIQSCADNLAASEKNLWDLLQATLKQPINPEKRSEIKWTDEQLINLMECANTELKTQLAFEPIRTPHKTVEEALETFKSERATHIKYIKGTTEDLRNHVLEMPFGMIDCYQLCLVISFNSNQHIQQIMEIKSDPKFPSR